MFYDKRAVSGASFVLLCCLNFPAPGSAQPGAETITVTATRSATALSQVPESVSVITAAQIADTPAQGLNDVLRNLPGMTLNGIGPDVGHPTAYNEAMRGLPTTETRMLVMVDGVPVNDPFFGYIQWNRIPLDNIARVEVVRGGGSPLWGNTAMGGVVNVITKAPRDNELEASASGGSYASYSASLYGAYRAAPWLTLSLNAALRGTQGYQTTPLSWTSFGSLNLRSPVYAPTSNQARSVNLRGDFGPADGIKGFIAIGYDEDKQILSTPIGLDHQRSWSYAGGLTQDFGDNASLSATYFHHDNVFVTDNPHLLTFTTEYNSNIHTTTASDNGASLVFTQQWGGLIKQVNLGADLHQISGHDLANYYAPSGLLAAPTIVGGGDQLFLAGFAQAQIMPVDRLELLASLRYQYYQASNGTDTFPPGFAAIPDVNKYRFTPRADARYALDDDLAVRASYYQSFRAPTLDQLYRTFADTAAGIFEGDPFLKPESLEGEEVGLDYDLPGLRSRFTLYTSKIGNLITQRNLLPSEFPNILGVNCGFDPVAFTFLACTRNINAASALARGFEAEITGALGGGFSSQWTYTYADSHYTADPVDPTAVGNRLEGVPMHNASAGLTYDDTAGWQASLILRYLSKSYGDAHPEDGLIQDAHFVVDVSGSYPLSRNVQAFVQVQNLFGARYIASNGGGAPILGTPFEMMGGVRVKAE